MTVSKRFQGLPDDHLIQIIRCYDNRTIWSTLSKKLRTLWLKAGIRAVSGQLQSLSRELIAGQPITLNNMDLLLQQARTHLSIQQTILIPAHQVDVNPIFIYRNIPRISHLHQQIDAARKAQLTAIDNWFAECSAHIKNTPQDGDPLIPNTQNFILIDQTFDRLLANNSFAAPLELLDLNLPPILFAKALIHSAKHHQIPFVKALVASNKVTSQIPAESWNQALASACTYNRQAPPPLLGRYEGLLKIIELIFPYSSRVTESFSGFLSWSRHSLPNNFADFFSTVRLFLEHPACKINTLTIDSIEPLLNTLPKKELLAFLRLLLASNKIDYGCMEKYFHAVLKAPSMTLENRLASLSLLLQYPTKSALSILIHDVLWVIVTNGVVVPPQALMDVIRLLLRDGQIDQTIYTRTQHRLEKARQDGLLPQNIFNQIQIALFEHPFFSIPFFTERLWNANKELSEEEFLKLLCTILDHQTTQGARLWKYFASAIGPYQSYDTYRTALRRVASHPHAAQMPLAVRFMIAFERAWAWVTFPIHGTFTFLFGWKVAQVITSLLLLPITLLRVLGAVFLHLAVLYGNPSR